MKNIYTCKTYLILILARISRVKLSLHEIQRQQKKRELDKVDKPSDLPTLKVLVDTAKLIYHESKNRRVSIDKKVTILLTLNGGLLAVMSFIISNISVKCWPIYIVFSISLFISVILLLEYISLSKYQFITLDNSRTENKALEKLLDDYNSITAYENGKIDYFADIYRSASRYFYLCLVLVPIYLVSINMSERTNTDTSELPSQNKLNIEMHLKEIVGLKKKYLRLNTQLQNQNKELNEIPRIIKSINNEIDNLKKKSESYSSNEQLDKIKLKVEQLKKKFSASGKTDKN